MAKQAKKKQRPRAGLLTRVVILTLLLGIGWQLFSLHGQVASAQAARDALADQVEAQRQANDALEADIAGGSSAEKMEELARDKLDYVTPGEYVFYDVSN